MPSAPIADALVLGAGIVGVSVALHLQKRGRATVLVDRRGAAEETSFGNAGLVQREGVYPYGFPHDFGALLRYSFNRTIDAHYHPSAIPRLAPFLWKYWHHSRPARHRAIAQLYAKLIEHCITEHEALAAEAGAMDLFRRSGWMKVFRTERERDLRFAEAERWRSEFGINFAALDRKQVQEKEPHLAPVLEGALHWTDPLAAVDPQARGARLPEAVRKAGRALRAGQRREPRSRRQRMARAHRRRRARRARRRRGARTVGRRRHAAPGLRPAARGEARLPHALPRRRASAVLNHPMLDTERGYFLAPMRRGIRLTTGAEFALARRDEDAGAAQPRRADRARAVSARRAPRRRSLDGLAPLHAGHDAGHRPGAAPPRTCGSPSAMRTTASRSAR